jgi:hypothetical protein
VDPAQFAITTKQAEVLTTVRDAPLTGVEEIFLIGPIGSTKTFVMAYAHVNIALQFDGSVIPVGRKDAAEHQIGTFLVYLETMEKMGMVAGKDYRTRQAPNDLQIRIGKSIIKFIGMNKSRDREWSKLKVMATAAGVDEADDVDEDGYDMLYSRTGRRNENGAPRVIIACCNPNDRWIKNKIYIPWKKREGKLPPDLDDPSIEPLPPQKVVIEFEMEDSPLYLTGYYDRFMERPRQWRERYLRNNWFYLDDEKSLFKSRALDTLTISRLKAADKFIGVDPNAGGPDRAAIVVWEGDTVVDGVVYTTEDLQRLALPDEKDPMNYGAVLGRLTRDVMQRERVGYRNVGGDVIGIGQGWLTDMLAHGMKVLQFRSGDAPIPTPVEKAKNIKPPYFHLRDQMFYHWSQDVTNARVFFYGAMPHLSSLKKELQLHEGDDTEKVMRVTPKDDLKLMLGHSPDIADAAMIGYWVRVLRKQRPHYAGQTSNVGSVGKSYESIYNANNGY